MNKGKTNRKTCPVCGGKRSWRAYVAPAVLAEMVAKARTTFVATHQGKGDVAVGQAFVPREIHDSADRKQLKMAEDAYGKPCNSCNWTGLAECKACKGTGIVKCSDKDCKEGWIVTTTTSSTSTTPDNRRDRTRNSSGFRHTSHHRSRTVRTTVTVTECPTCQGAAMSICRQCQGMRASSCQKCRGAGFRQRK